MYFECLRQYRYLVIKVHSLPDFVYNVYENILHSITANQ